VALRAAEMNKSYGFADFNKIDALALRCSSERSTRALKYIDWSVSAGPRRPQSYVKVCLPQTRFFKLAGRQQDPT